MNISPSSYTESNKPFIKYWGRPMLLKKIKDADNNPHP
ncbi:hypothetical protein RV13_GL000064 [Enterococcus raffinosus]|nr:hypothetical protein RV13_GL000064 [Enterococcus raffinosus]